MTALEFIQRTAICTDGHPDAAWVSTPTDGPRYSCKECDKPTPAPVPATAWSFRSQMNRVRGMIA